MAKYRNSSNIETDYFVGQWLVIKKKKPRLPRKIKKLAKMGSGKKYKLSKETLTNLSISFWGKIRQYRTTKYKYL